MLQPSTELFGFSLFLTPTTLVWGSVEFPFLSFGEEANFETRVSYQTLYFPLKGGVLFLDLLMIEPGKPA